MAFQARRDEEAGIRKNLIVLAGLLVVCALVFSVIKIAHKPAEPGGTPLGSRTERITRIDFIRPVEGNLFFLKESGKWKVRASPDRSFPCEESAMKDFLYALGNMKLTDMVSEDAADWEKFDIQESKGALVNLYYEDRDKPAVSFTLGKRLGYGPD